MRFTLKIDSKDTTMNIQSLASHLAGVSQYLYNQTKELTGIHYGPVLNFDDEMVGQWELECDSSEKI